MRYPFQVQYPITRSWHQATAEQDNSPGTTYGCPAGVQILAPADGRVMLAHWKGDAGRCVNIRIDALHIISLRNIRALFALETEQVTAGQVIATTAGPLTVVVWNGWRAVDPEAVWESA